MKKIALLTLLLFTVTTFAGAFIDFFNARSEDGKVRLDWKTAEEVSVKEFIIERKPVRANFSQISVVKPKGDNSYYVFYDENAYKEQDAVYIYRLKIVDYDNNVSYSKEVSVNHTVSGVKKTWGSIKSMFR
ncbi:MAG: hypothetical protein HUU43_11395 [Ignavibacteriaceae bacterium]|nr:hypothetical protein [Ignavibacteriaceae bacterium]NUM71447.1 hypothetical protein [Ignavibacteriaceae bacterium]